MDPKWRLEKYWGLLQVQVRKAELGARMRVRMDSLDVVQEALLRAHKDLPNFRGTTEGQLVRWLQQILERTLLDMVDFHKAEKRDVSKEEAMSMRGMMAQSTARLNDFVDRKPSPSDEAQRLEFLGRLGEAVKQLKEDQRDVFILSDLMETPVKTIADQLRTSEKSVAGLLRRARANLRELLGDFK